MQSSFLLNIEKLSHDGFVGRSRQQSASDAKYKRRSRTHEKWVKSQRFNRFHDRKIRLSVSEPVEKIVNQEAAEQ